MLRRALTVVFYVGVLLVTTLFFESSFRGSYDITPNLPELSLNYNRKVEHNAIIRLHNKENQFFCSAFVVSDNYAVTAGHCIDGLFGSLKQSIHVHNDLMQDTFVVARGVAINRRGDTGLIQGDFTNFAKLVFQASPGGILQNVSERTAFKSCGFPYGDHMLCTPIIIRGNEYFYFKGEGYLYPGMSGGPLVEEKTGIVIGINSYVAEQNVGFASLVGLFSSFGVKIVW